MSEVFLVTCEPYHDNTDVMGAYSSLELAEGSVKQEWNREEGYYIFNPEAPESSRERGWPNVVSQTEEIKGDTYLIRKLDVVGNQWTQKPPTEPGWYWIYRGEKDCEEGESGGLAAVELKYENSVDQNLRVSLAECEVYLKDFLEVTKALWWQKMVVPNPPEIAKEENEDQGSNH